MIRFLAVYLIASASFIAGYVVGSLLALGREDARS
jgi:hypothetical protein